MYQPKPRWTAKQVEFLKNNAFGMKDEDIAEMLGKTIKSIRRKRERLEMKKACGRGIVKKFEPAFQGINQETPNSPPIG